MKDSSSLLQVFCKAPVAGQVKTRLQPQLSAMQSARVHRQLTLRTLDLVCRLANFEIELWCSPDCTHEFFKQLLCTYPVSLKQQADADLGWRMHHALSGGLQSHRRVMLIGCDIPSFVDADFIQAASSLQQGNDVVIAPCEDGGYALIGLRQSQPALFTEISWGGEHVMQQTRRKLHQLKLDSVEIRTQWDVDDFSDYQRLRKTCPEFVLA